MAEFSWAAAGDVGLGLLSGLSSGLTALGNAQTANANARTANIVRTAQNDVKRSQRNLAGEIRSINNKRIMDAAGAQLDVLTTNAVRTSDAFVRGNFEQSIKGAEAWGQASARAAASGLGGAGIEAISRATSLTLARQQEATESRQGDVTFDQTQATTKVVSNALIGLAAGPLTASQDFSYSPQASSGTGIAGALVQGLLGKKDSLNVLLGSLVGAPTEPAGTGAVTSPVGQSTVEGKPLATFNIEPSPYEDTQRLINRSNNITLN